MNNKYGHKTHAGNISELKNQQNRPLWSVIIPTYNCATYLKSTLQSVLAQNVEPEKMEIIVIDDFSIEHDPEAVVIKYGKGRVKFIRQKKNVGKSRNYESGISASKGYFIHLLHGDDTINSGFYNKLENLFNSFPNAGAAFCRCNYINSKSEIIGTTGLLSNKDGILTDFKYTIASWQQIQPPSVVFKREVYEKMGGYDKRLNYFEDWEFYVRVALNYDYVYTPEIFANYRIFEENSSTKSIYKGKRLKHITSVEKIIDGYLPSQIKSSIKPIRKKSKTEYLLLFIPKLVKKRDYLGYWKTIICITKTTPGFRSFLRAMKLTLNNL